MAKAIDKDSLFWIGEGCLNIDGVDYHGDKALPVSKINKDSLAIWKKAGKIGERIKPVAVNTELKQAQELILTQSDKIKELTEQAELDTAEIVELKAQVEALTEPKE